jgi:hypothetical protein
MSAPKTRRLYDLLCVINALDGTFRIEKYEKEYERQRKEIYKLVIEEAHALYHYSNISISTLNRALKKAGWEDQTFVCNTNKNMQIVNT